MWILLYLIGILYFIAFYSHVIIEMILKPRKHIRFFMLITYIGILYLICIYSGIDIYTGQSCASWLFLGVIVALIISYFVCLKFVTTKKLLYLTIFLLLIGLFGTFLAGLLILIKYSFIKLPLGTCFFFV